jgi:hypothetical protein
MDTKKLDKLGHDIQYVGCGCMVLGVIIIVLVVLALSLF